jgi:hypothetical protein
MPVCGLTAVTVAFLVLRAGGLGSTSSQRKADRRRKETTPDDADDDSQRLTRASSCTVYTDTFGASKSLLETDRKDTEARSLLAPKRNLTRTLSQGGTPASKVRHDIPVAMFCAHCSTKTYESINWSNSNALHAGIESGVNGAPNRKRRKPITLDAAVDYHVRLCVRR